MSAHPTLSSTLGERMAASASTDGLTADDLHRACAA
jgi:hypothetical protein